MIISLKCAVQQCLIKTTKLRRGYCQKHYINLKKYQDPLYYEKKIASTPNHCKIENCIERGQLNSKGTRYFPSGYCSTHYHRINRNGDENRKTKIRGGKHNRPLTDVWYGMYARCYKNEHNSYKYYGGRGINMCDRWHDFDLFELDMGERPEGMTLDRIDANGNYEPSNCRWATAKEQANNTRSNNNLTIDGSTKTVTQWSELSDVGGGQIARRVKAGWTHKDAVFIPRLRKRSKKT